MRLAGRSYYHGRMSVLLCGDSLTTRMGISILMHYTDANAPGRFDLRSHFLKLDSDVMDVC